MSIIIRLQNLPWSANSLDIRRFFTGLSIPEGGVHIVGGEMGDAFIAFSTDEDARLAMEKDGGKIKDMQIKLLLSSRTEMMRVIEQARQQNMVVPQPPVVIPQTPILSVQLPTRNVTPTSESERRRDRSASPHRRSRDRSPARDRRRSPDDRRKRDRSRSPSRSSRNFNRDMDRRNDRFRREDRRYDDSRYRDDRRSDKNSTQESKRYPDADHVNSKSQLHVTEGFRNVSSTYEQVNTVVPGLFPYGNQQTAVKGIQETYPHTSSNLPSHLPQAEQIASRKPQDFQPVGDQKYSLSATYQHDSSSYRGSTFQSSTKDDSVSAIDQSMAKLRGQHARFESEFVPSSSSVSSHFPADNTKSQIPYNDARSLPGNISGNYPDRNSWSHETIDRTNNKTWNEKQGNVLKPPMSKNGEFLQGVPMDVDQPPSNTSEKETYLETLPHRGPQAPVLNILPRNEDLRRDNQNRGLPGNKDHPNQDRGHISRDENRKTPIKDREVVSHNEKEGLSLQERGPLPRGDTRTLSQQERGPLSHGANRILPMQDRRPMLHSENRIHSIQDRDQRGDENQTPLMQVRIPISHGENRENLMQNRGPMLHGESRNHLLQDRGPISRNENIDHLMQDRGPMSRGENREHIMHDRGSVIHSENMTHPMSDRGGMLHNENRRFPAQDRGTVSPSDGRMPPSLTVEVRGLPPDARIDDILDLFHGIPLPAANIRIEANNHGLEKAFIRFVSVADFEEALRRNRQFIHEGRCELIPCPAAAFDGALRSQKYRPKLKPRDEDLTVQMRGLPFLCKEEDIVRFFEGLGILDLFIEIAPDGRAAGTGFVEFGTHEDFRTALTMHGKMIGHRYITVSIASKEMMAFARGEDLNPEASGPRPPPRFSDSSHPLNAPINQNQPPSNHIKPPGSTINQGRQGNPPVQTRTPPCISMKGLPQGVTNRDIIDFLGEMNVMPRAVHIMLRPDKTPSGEAFAEFGSPSDMDSAIQLDGNVMRGNCVSIKPISFHEMSEILGRPSMVPPSPTPPALLRTPVDSERPNRPPPVDGERPHRPPPVDGERPHRPPPVDSERVHRPPPVDSERVHRPPPIDDERPRRPPPVDIERPRRPPSVDVERPRRPPSVDVERPHRPPPIDVERPLRPPPIDVERPLRPPPIDVERPHRPPPADIERPHRLIPNAERPRRPLLPQGPHEGMFRDRPHMEPLGRPFGPGRMRAPWPNRPYGNRHEGRFPPPPPLGEHGLKDFGAPGCVVSINNLHFKAGLEELLDFFRDYRISKDNIRRKYNENGQTTGEARIAFQNPRDAHRAVRELNQRPIMGRSLHLSVL